MRNKSITTHLHSGIAWLYKISMQIMLVHGNNHSPVYGKCYEKQVDHPTDSKYVKMNMFKLMAMRSFGECK